MLTTVVLVAITLLFYFVFSSAFMYIPQPTLLGFGFSLSTNLLAIFSYSFVHISLSHLFGNVVILAAVGLVAEQKLGSRDTLAIYFLSGGVAALLFSLLEPNTVLVGSSAAISGLVIAALLVDLKKSVVAIAAALVLLAFVIQPLLISYVVGTQAGVAAKTIELNDTLKQAALEKNATLAKIAGVNSSLEQAREQLRTGAISNETYAKIASNLTKQYENLTAEVSALGARETTVAASLNTTARLGQSIDEGRQREHLTKTNLFIHLAGAMVGLFYITLVRKDILWSLPSQLSMPAFLSERLRRSREPDSRKRSK